MKTLSFQQPWPWLLTQGIKRIENRDWKTDYRGTLLLHASKTFDPHVYYLHERLHGVAPFSLKDTSFLEQMPRKDTYELGGIVGIADLVDIVTESADPWFHGKFGWVFANARPLPFHACRGQLWLFDFDERLLNLEEGEVVR